jgi:uncharacterized repeat protein (TIGR03803 family)
LIRKENSMPKRTLVALVLLALTTLATPSPAQTFTSLLSFSGANGSKPFGGPLVQGLDGNFYGTTWMGGTSGDGTVYRITPAGGQTTLHSFDGTDGKQPLAGLVLGTDGNFYGGTEIGGAHGFGTLFKITPSGTLTTIYNFCAEGGECVNTGSQPIGGLVQGHDGNFYGTTAGAGGTYGHGTIFKITPAGALTTLYSFNEIAGSYMPLVQTEAGEFWGLTDVGGADNFGTVYTYNSGTFTTVLSFDGSNGSYPDYGALVQDTSGNFYGTTSQGGAYTTCGDTSGCGTVFKVTSGGVLTTLHSFGSSSADGAAPLGGLGYGTDGNFYGAAEAGGTNNDGVLFNITPGGTLTTLHSFDGTDGKDPLAALLQATNGIFYGTTEAGGTSSDGTVFSVSLSLAPFVRTVPTYGAVGTRVFILGTNLTGATKVTFDGTSAAFTVVSATEITTTVPSGASTGIVEVTTPRGTLSSNVSFDVP